MGKVDVFRTAGWEAFVTLNTPKVTPVHARPQMLNKEHIPSLKDVFWKIWKDSDYQLPTDVSKCYIFELLTPLETNVVEHSQSELILLGVRSVINLAEEPPHEAAKLYNWKCVNGFPTNSMDEVEEQCRGLDATKKAGFVLCDAHFKRLMVRYYKSLCPSVLLFLFHQLQMRSPQFQSLEKLNPLNDPGQNLKLMLDIIRTNPHQTWIALPRYAHWVMLYNHVHSLWEEAVAAIEKVYEPIKANWDPNARGVFAAKANKASFKSILFGLMSADCKAEVRSFLASISTRRAQGMLKAMFDAKEVTKAL